MKPHILPLLLMLATLSAQAQDTPKRPTKPVPKVPCISLQDIEPSMDPIFLTRAMISCIQEGRTDPAVDLFNMGGVFAKFDSLRVSDKSAHAAYPALKVQAEYALTPEQQTRFNKELQIVSMQSGYHETLCRFTATLDPPSYQPTYMTNHGMGAFTGGKQTVDNFNPETAWASVRSGYLKCK